MRIRTDRSFFLRLLGAAFAWVSFSRAWAADPSFVVSLAEGGYAEVTAVDSAGAATVAIPASWGGADVRALGPYAFIACEGLEEVSIPASVEQIDPCAFANCASLTDIRVDDANPTYSDVDGVLFDVTGEILVFCPE